MQNENVAIAEAYYKAWGEKNVEKMEQYLHQDVQLIGPIANLKGKAMVVEALKRGGPHTVNIRAKFGSGNQTMLALDMSFLDPIGNLRSAVLMTFKEGLIAKIELFFDPRIFDKIL